jgi:Carboxypeptidase regulatory-like domain
MRIRSLRRKARILALVTLISLLVGPLAARAQSSTIAGSVHNAQHKPVAAATITLSGNGRHLSTQTDPRGAFRFEDVAPGSYQLRIVEPGFLPYRRTIAVPSRAPIAVVLRPTTLPVIGSVTGVARTPFNAKPVAQRVFPREACRDQGQPSTASVLDQTPGALIARPTYLNNAAPLGPVTPLVRGGLSARRLSQADLAALVQKFATAFAKTVAGQKRYMR